MIPDMRSSRPPKPPAVSGAANATSAILRAAEAYAPNVSAGGGSSIPTRSPNAPAWWQIVNRAGQRPELRIYDEISPYGVSAAGFTASLEALDVGELDVRINSPGGSVFDGIAIHNAIARHRARTTVYIDGLAGSAASFIAMAGDDIAINRYASMMIHDASGLVVGTAADMGKFAGVLNQLSDTIAQVYADRAGGTVADWREAMLAETWYGADAAVAAGLADRVEGGPSRAARPAASSLSPALAAALATARRRRAQRMTGVQS